MKIAFISTNNHSPWGGSEELWCKAAIECRRRGAEVCISIAEWCPQPKLIQEASSLGIKIYHHLKRPGFPKKAADKAIRHFFQGSHIISAPNYREVLSISRPGFVLISMGDLPQGLQAMEACYSCKVPFATVIQLVGNYHAFNDNVRAKLIKLYQVSQANFFVSSKNLELAEKKLAHRFSNARIIKNPIRMPHVDPLPYPRDSRYYNLAFVAGLITVHKGQDDLFEVLRKPKWKRRNLFINFYGDGPNRDTLHDLALLWDIKNVKFHGYVSSLDEIWSSNHALIMASHMEGSPLCLAEAMYCNRIGIVPNIGGNSELISNSVNGFLAKSSNPSDLDEAMENAWEVRKHWEMMGVAAHNTVVRLYRNPVNDFVDQLESIYSINS